MNSENNIDVYSVVAEFVNFDSETGKLTWKERDSSLISNRRWNGRHAFKECGSIRKDGYLNIIVNAGAFGYRNILYHRLVWFMYYGCFPKHQIDHINRIKTDNRISNLRDVPNSINKRNCGLYKSNSSGFSGVSWSNRDKKWLVMIGVDGKSKNLGLFNSIAEANEIATSFRLNNGFTETHGMDI